MAAVPSTGRADHVDRVAVPEADATRALYERYANQIFGYCLHQLGSREEAEDAVQSTFLNAFRGLKRGIVPEMESAWLFKIAHNVCLSRRRSSWRRGRIESPADFDLVEELAPAPSRLAEELMGLQDVLETMPENQRRAILLREWQGLSYREIAAELALTQAAVETLIFRARRSLASGLERPPAPARSRARLAGDLGNLLAGIKSMLLGSAAAAKVAATVAVISATTVVAASPVQRPLHHATPPAPASPSSSGAAGAGASALVPSPTAVLQRRPASMASRRTGASHGALAPSAVVADVPFGPSAVVDGTTTAQAPSQAPSEPSVVQQAPPQPSQPEAPAQSSAPPAATIAPAEPSAVKKHDQTSGSSAAGVHAPADQTTTVQQQPLSQTATPGVSQANGQSQSGAGRGTTQGSTSSSQTTQTQSSSAPTSVPRVPVTGPVASPPGSPVAGSGSGSGLVAVVGGPLSQRVTPPGSATTPGAPSAPSSSGLSSTGG